jgi:hypothetical protein
MAGRDNHIVHKKAFGIVGRKLPRMPFDVD